MDSEIEAGLVLNKTPIVHADFILRADRFSSAEVVGNVCHEGCSRADVFVECNTEYGSLQERGR